jgi:hypothetical protein
MTDPRDLPAPPDEVVNRWIPKTIAPSDRYGFLLEGDPSDPSVRVVQRVGDTWGPTPASWKASTLLEDPEPTQLAIDYGAGWMLDPADTNALLDFAADAVLDGMIELAR